MKKIKAYLNLKMGKWKDSNIFQQIKEIKDLNTGRVINDFQYTVSILVKPNKYFPESTNHYLVLVSLKLKVQNIQIKCSTLQIIDGKNLTHLMGVAILQ